MKLDKKKVARGSCMEETAWSANCPNSTIYAWTALARGPAPLSSLWVVSCTVTRACRFETRLQHEGTTPWTRDMSRTFLDSDAQCRRTSDPGAVRVQVRAPRRHAGAREPVLENKRYPVRRKHRGHAATSQGKENEETIHYLDVMSLYP